MEALGENLENLIQMVGHLKPKHGAVQGLELAVVAYRAMRHGYQKGRAAP